MRADSTDNRSTQPSGGRRSGRRKTRGQSLVEFAVILPVFVLIFALAADFGRGLTAYITVTGAAREGAAYGAQTMTMANDTAGIMNAAMQDAGAIWGGSPAVAVVGPNSCVDPVSGQFKCVQVTVNYAFQPILPFPPIPNSIPMTRTVQMRVVN